MCDKCLAMQFVQKSEIVFLLFIHVSNEDFYGSTL